MLDKLFGSTTSNPARWFVDWLRNGTENNAGVSVTYNSALTSAYVFSAVSQISADIASLPVNVMKIDGNGDRDIVAHHPAQWLLNEETAFEGYPMDSLAMRETMISHALLWGNGYAGIERDGTATPRRLVPIMPDSVDVLLDDSGQVFYRVWPDARRGAVVSGQHIDVRSEDMFHLKGMGWDGLSGHSIISLARNSFGLGLAQEKHGASVFKSGAQPSIALRTEAKLDKEAADTLLERWEERHSGTNKPALLSHGLEIQPFSMSNEDSQWLESRAFQRIEVAVWFKMPPHKLGDSSKIAFNSIESENRSYLNQTLNPWMKKFESECRRKLLTERARRGRTHIIVHDTQDFLTADIETQVDVLTKLQASTAITRNEVRRKLGFKTAGPEGDVFENPNVQSGGSQEVDENEEPTTSTLDARALAGQRGLVSDRLSRMIDIESKAAKRAAEKGGNFVEWVDTFYDEFATKMAASLDPVLAAYRVLPGVKSEVDAEIVAQDHAKASKANLLAVAGYSNAENLAQNVEDMTAVWRNRADKVSREIIEGSNDV